MSNSLRVDFEIEWVMQQEQLKKNIQISNSPRNLKKEVPSYKIYHGGVFIHTFRNSMELTP